MKTVLKLFSFAIIFFFLISNTFSQLNGTYTIGSGGNYPTINSAVNDVVLQGVSGPVVFDIMSGIYNEETYINPIPGASTINTVTFKSQAGNPDSVVINGAQYIFILNQTRFVKFQELTFGNSTLIAIALANQPHNITILGNKFSNNDIAQYGQLACNNLLIQGNSNIRSIDFDGRDFIPGYNIKIIDNSINQIQLIAFGFVLIEKNIVNNVYCSYINGNINKNKIRTLYLFNILGSLLVCNNFISSNSGTLFSASGVWQGLRLIYNTFNYTNSTGTNAIRLFDSFRIVSFNNLFINASGGSALFVSNNTDSTFLSSDYNNYYNGGNSDLINYNGSSYNNVNDFYNATGLDQHSNSVPVQFISSTDLHLTGSSLGNIELAGIPTSIVIDDIDGNPRSATHPYKGADEPDIPLPAELSSFISIVNNDNVQLRWTTTEEINNSGFDVERSDVKSETSSEWKTIGFIQANGTMSSLKNYEYTDRNLSSGKFQYRLKQIDYNGNFAYHNLSNEVVIGVPSEFKLYQNYPNPFNPKTIINYHLSVYGYVRLSLFGANGEEVKTLVNKKHDPGYYSIELDASNLSSGIYFYTLSSGNFKETKKMVLIK